MSLELNENNFQAEVLESDVPVLVDFWAPWCGPCKMIAPLIDQVANEVEGTAKVGKVNVDENPGLARQYGISSIPALHFFKNGEAKQQITGANVSADKLKSTLTSL